MIPEFIPVKLIVWPYRLDIPYGRIRVRIMKFLQEMIELFSDW